MSAIEPARKYLKFSVLFNLNPPHIKAGDTRRYPYSEEDSREMCSMRIKFVFPVRAGMSRGNAHELLHGNITRAFHASVRVQIQLSAVGIGRDLLQQACQDQVVEV